MLRPPFAVAATATPRADPDANQDAFVVLDERTDGLCAAVVADGVGSLPGSGHAARAATDAAADAFAASGPLAFTEAFCRAQEAVDGLNSCGPAATTLLCATVPGPGQYAAGYVGNGGLLAVSLMPAGPGRSGGTVARWVDHLVPQVGVDNGRETTWAIAPGAPTPATPIEIWFASPHPTALCVVTDGIWSSEQYPAGVTSDGGRWRPQPTTLTRTIEAAETFLRDLTQDWPTPPAATEPGTGHQQARGAESTRPEPEAALADELAAMNEAGDLDDDATIAVLITEPTP